MHRFFSASFFSALFFVAHVVCAQNMVQNPAFSSVTQINNPWGGVDKEGFISGATHSVPLLSVSDGSLQGRPVPPSVVLADMNNNGLLDIVMMDGWNYLRIFFNQGTKEEPKFSTGDLSHFILRLTPNEPIVKALGSHMFGQARAPYNNYIYGGRIAITEAFNTGRKDIVMGNFAGDVYPLLNTGSTGEPKFEPFKGAVFKLRIPISNAKPADLKNWGSLLSPLTADFFGSGRQDLLFGEASYSANNIHIFRNKGGSDPQTMFDVDEHRILAYGDGKEWLVPCAMDYTGNGKSDLLVADGSGKVSVYINHGKPWPSKTAPPEFEFHEYVKTTAGADLSFGGPCTIAVGDLTGDGLLDIIAGKPNGRVAVAYNKGTKEEPRFTAPVEIKSIATVGKKPAPSAEAEAAPAVPHVEQITLPLQWTVDWGLNRGNFHCVPQVLKTEEGETGIAAGVSYMRIAYLPTPNLVMQQISDAMYPRASDPNYSTEELFKADPRSRVSNGFTARSVRISTGGMTFTRTNRYVLTFKYKGTFNGGMAGVGYGAGSHVFVSDGGRRGGGQHVYKNSGNGHDATLSSSSNAWQQFRLEFTVSIPDKDLWEQPIGGGITISCEFPSTKGELCIADVKLEPAK